MGIIDDYVQILKGLQDDRKQVRLLNRFLKAAAKFDRVMWDLSRDYTEIYDCEPQLCCENCQKIALRVPGLKYYGGFVAHGGLVEGRAWLVAENNEVAEPTIALLEALAEGVQEYMGVWIPKNYIVAQAAAKQEFLPLIEPAYLDKIW